MPKTLVLGHINPDTDTICSAIAYAWYLTSTGQEAEAVIAGQPPKEAAFVLEHFKVPAPRLISALTKEDQVALVDTNNPDELVTGIEEAELISIMDHHKLVGGLSTSNPIHITIRPVACTATLILQEIVDPQTIPVEIAGIMAAAIVSDTLLFTSPTTTELDKKAAHILATRANCNLEELADEMFAAKSDLTGLSPRDIVTMDSKVIAMGSKKVRISSLETTLPSTALALRADLEQALTQLKKEENLDAAFLFIVDILKSNATLLVPSDVEREIAAQAFNVPFTREVLELPGVVSRKKQMVPPLEAVLTN